MTCESLLQPFFMGKVNLRSDEMVPEHVPTHSVPLHITCVSLLVVAQGRAEGCSVPMRHKASSIFSNPYPVSD